MIDIHCHILPAMDDGPYTLQISLEMAIIAAGDGIKTVIATPHTDGINVNRDSVTKAVTVFNRELLQRNIRLDVLPGYEIPYHLVSELAATHTLAESKYMLLEFPHEYLPMDATSTVYTLIAAGLIPIIAHPERNGSVLDDPDLLGEIKEAGGLVQLTAGSITGELGPDVQQCALQILEKGQADFIATDSHSPVFRTPVLKKAHAKVKKIFGRQLADKLIHENPAMIFHKAK